MTPALEVVRPGRLEYEKGLALQAELVRTVAASGGQRAFLVLTEHPPVYTLGKNASEEHILRRDPGIPVVRTERGGEVTYHGPGQLIGYPILSLRAYRLTVRRFVCALERSLIALLARHDIAAVRREGTAGLWVEERKICSIGLRVARGITSHGFALNVDTDLGPFERINPCGEAGMRMTSVALEASAGARISALEAEFIAEFREHLRERGRCRVA